MLFKTGKSAAIFLKHRMAKGKAAAMAGMQKAKTATMKGVSKGKALASKAGSQFSAANAIAIKKSKQATNAYLKSIKNRRISSAVDLGIGATGGYLIGSSGDKVKLKKSDPNYKALKRAGYI